MIRVQSQRYDLRSVYFAFLFRKADSIVSFSAPFMFLLRSASNFSFSATVKWCFQSPTTPEKK